MIRVALATVVVLTLAGCDGQASTPSQPPSLPSPTASATTTSAPTPGPTADRTPAPESAPVQEATITVGSDTRVVDLYVPETTAAAAAPLLILLHASGESTFAMATESHAGELAAREGVIVALPPAHGRRWDGMVSPVDPITPSADATFLVGLIDELAKQQQIDTKRVFIAGFSIGAVMSERMACQFADRMTAVALNAGAPWSESCSPARPVPILVMHGTSDTTYKISLAREVVNRWRAADQCSGNPAVSRLSDIATAETNDDCAEGVEVKFVQYAGIGHRWFSNPSATDVLWSFFAAAPSR